MKTLGLVEDNDLYRTSLEIAIMQNPSYKLIWSAIDGVEALEKFKSKPCDILIADIEIPRLDGISLIEKIKEQKDETKIIILTAHTEKSLVINALKSHISAYCSKSITIGKLMLVIQMAVEGALWFDPEISNHIQNLINQSSKLKAIPGYGLSIRELEVLKLIAEGKPNKEIAHKLFITIHTVKAHIVKILEKLMVKDRTEASVKAVREGLLIG